jgi:hypothetical protein
VLVEADTAALVADTARSYNKTIDHTAV